MPTTAIPTARNRKSTEGGHYHACEKQRKAKHLADERARDRLIEDALNKTDLGSGCQLSAGVFEKMARKGNIEMMMWLFENACPWGTMVFFYAAEYGDLATLKWLLANGCPHEEGVFAGAASNGNLDNMKWMLEEGFTWDEWTFSNAAHNGSIKNMQWLKDNGCPYVLVYMHPEICPMTTEVCDWIKENLK